jgi:hypothetical protein
MLAANSVLQFPSSGYGLKPTEWQHFYRLLDSAALTHLFPRGLGAGFTVSWRGPDRGPGRSGVAEGAHRRCSGIVP